MPAIEVATRSKALACGNQNIVAVSAFGLADLRIGDEYGSPTSLARDYQHPAPWSSQRRGGDSSSDYRQ